MGIVRKGRGAGVAMVQQVVADLVLTQIASHCDVERHIGSIPPAEIVTNQRVTAGATLARLMLS